MKDFNPRLIAELGTALEGEHTSNAIDLNELTESTLADPPRIAAAVLKVVCVCLSACVDGCVYAFVCRRAWMCACMRLSG